MIIFLNFQINSTCVDKTTAINCLWL